LIGQFFKLNYCSKNDVANTFDEEAERLGMEGFKKRRALEKEAKTCKPQY
jgi:hypothetical protein